MAKEIFNSKVEEEKEKKAIELTNKIIIADNYKDQRNEPVGVIIIALLSLLLGGTLTGIFVFLQVIDNIAFIIIDIIIWVLLLALIIYSLFFYIVNRNMPKEALLFDKDTNEFIIYNKNIKDYSSYDYKLVKSITYKNFMFYPKQNLVGPIPKKPVGDKLVIELTDNTKIKLPVLDVFKARKILSEIELNNKKTKQK